MSSNDGESLAADGDPSHHAAPEMSLRQRWLIYLGVWVIALSCTFPAAPMFIYLPFFPLGLLVWIDPRMNTPEQAPAAAILLVWIGYALHGAVTLKSRTRWRFYLLMLVLALILGLNVAGCHRSVTVGLGALH
jgi:hypothetical protein